MKKKYILSFFFSMFFILMMVNPALTQENVKGVCVGGGEWASLLFPSIHGNTSFSLRANFRGNASGGHVHVSGKDGTYFFVEIDPDYSSILYGNWNLLAPPYSVQGYAFWGIGQVVDTNIALPPDSWALVGAYDGSESDYLLAFPGLSELDAWSLYNELESNDNQIVPLRVVLDKGNVTINVMTEKP